MKIELLSVGVRAPQWVQSGFDEYATRLPSSWALTLKEIQPATRGKSGNSDVFRRHEAEALMASVKPDHRLIALDLKGRTLSTAQLASRLDGVRHDFSGLQLMIGGADGLDGRCLERADERWCLSSLTFPHFLVRVIIAEQIYRAWTILNHHPYHR
ncbi:MAG: 23S rRNA (pseudouridine(1915)-N(3))-methyltransferase RlmH [Pseudomonadota bacterium]